jgi:hypothetical protein
MSSGMIQKNIPAASWATSTGDGVPPWPNTGAKEAKRINGAQSRFMSLGYRKTEEGVKPG